jgi:hypothetical protein
MAMERAGGLIDFRTDAFYNEATIINSMDLRGYKGCAFPQLS